MVLYLRLCVLPCRATAGNIGNRNALGWRVLAGGGAAVARKRGRAG